MQYVTLSFTHKNTDINIREKLSFNTKESLALMLENLTKIPLVNEAIVLSTCNRVEMILSVKECKKEVYELICDMLGRYAHVDSKDLLQRVDIYEETAAIHHLFSVASSLDSLVIGETQIAGQLKDAFKFSFESGFCAQKLGRAMHHAFRCAAMVRNCTSISKNPTSIASVAVSKAKELVGKLDGCDSIVLGIGEMGELAAKHLLSAGSRVILVNRNIENAKKLASTLGENVSVAPYSRLQELINTHSLLFSATGAPHSVITKDMVNECHFNRYWFDIAVPRDIEVCPTSNLFVFSVDDLEEIVSKNMALREEQARSAYAIIGRMTMEFYKWLQTLNTNPLIKEMREKARLASVKEVERAIKKGFIPKELKDSVMKIIHQSFNTFLHNPTVNIKSIAEKPEGDTVIQSLQYLFDMNEDTQKKINNYKCEYKMERTNEIF